MAIPMVDTRLGSTSYSNIFNFRSDPRQLATHLHDLIDDKAKYVEYFWWKDFYTGNIYNLLYVYPLNNSAGFIHSRILFCSFFQLKRLILKALLGINAMYVTS
jgi:hypothetical protein